ncbi:acyl-CoA dehydrogenase family protein [Nocardioides dongkuii]|uniref:acyl-CoA dehydrogenase family protein n=1 Tax=Nocardioides dongkuii TaxID=2760089 RepID=UPI0018782FAD|nr:acyl-CoA dehydrogenase family protein [Nocardioides dongkuii]
MHIALTPEQERLRRETHAYFEALMTPERRAALTFVDGQFRDGDVYLETIRQLGEDGWLGLGWPPEFGGQGRSMVDQLIFNDAAAVAGVAIPYLTINTIGPTLMRYGTPAQKEYFLPRILRGELHFAVGYSEPDAGTDLAALRTTARLDGTLEDGSFVVSGQKMWTSQIKYADWVWLAVRTDAELPRHKGLSIMMVPTDADGFSTSPVDTVAGLRTSATYFDQVRVPAANLVGELNGGWPLITNQLNHERVALFSAAGLQQHIHEVTRWARETRRPDGRRVADDEWVRNLLGVAHARTEMLSLMNWKLATTIDTLGPAEASATKIFGSENALEVYRMLMEIVGPDAGLTPDSAGAVLAGRLERYHRSHLVLTFGGGTNEIQRDMIGYQALGLPAARR